MPNIFIYIFNMSIAGSYIIILGLFARFFLQALSKKYSYFLWAIVYLRLIFPFTLNIRVILNFFRGYEAIRIISKTEFIPQPIVTALSDIDAMGTNVSFASWVITFLTLVWFLGFIGLILNETFAYFYARKKLLTAIRIKDNIFETDQISTPFLFGIIKPKIYVPIGITEKEMDYVLCHEQIHIKRKDYLIKLFTYFVTAAHWFNPFAWLAFKNLSCDIEMSCDEKILALLGNDVRKEYAETIFYFSNTKIKITRSMIAFGKSDTRKRVSNVLNKKKNNVVKIIAITIISSIIILGLIFNSSFSSLFSFIGNKYNSSEIRRLVTTDLSNISIDMIEIGSNIEDVDLSTYQKSDRFKNKNGDFTYYFNELVLDIDANKVSYIFAFNKDVVLSIYGNKGISTIDEITDLLGKNYLEKAEDNGQRLMKHIYKDSQIGVVAEFIYSDYDRQFVWITLRSIR
ncbi:MAG: hypothetical protein A2Y23_00920 [Clostridiales bacterium GWB2_37_7]|nr:MAG: hypothetical protein A2Y23_00920 [Clostridiales bacterium GWB2_37_7]